jgi:hypothetical protein
VVQLDAVDDDRSSAAAPASVHCAVYIAHSGTEITGANA